MTDTKLEATRPTLGGGPSLWMRAGLELHNGYDRAFLAAIKVKSGEHRWSIGGSRSCMVSLTENIPWNLMQAQITASLFQAPFLRILGTAIEGQDRDTLQEACGVYCDREEDVE